MQQSINRSHSALIYVGITLLFPLLLPFPYVLYDLLMSHLVSVVWGDLHRVTYNLGKMLFVYGFSATLASLFVVKLHVSERLQPQYTSVMLWSIGCALALTGFGYNLLITAGVVSPWLQEPSMKQVLLLILFAGKIILSVAFVRMLIGMLPNSNK